MIEMAVGFSFANLVLVGALVFRVGRWAGAIETRVSHLEDVMEEGD